jgi:hypothetical protein
VFEPFFCYDDGDFRCGSNRLRIFIDHDQPPRLLDRVGDGYSVKGDYGPRINHFDADALPLQALRRFEGSLNHEGDRDDRDVSSFSFYVGPTS